MAATVHVSVEEYLKTVYRPDCDYVDGIVEERNVGQVDHGWVQSGIVSYFRSRFRETGIAALPATRMQITSGRFRVPDVVVTRGKPDEQVITKAPLLCIEILSPEDRVSRVNERIKEYLNFGVPAVWLVDPADRTIWVYRLDRIEQSKGDTIRVDGTSIEIPFSEIFEWCGFRTANMSVRPSLAGRQPSNFLHPNI